jgi:osmotically-inducible protein OsmY
VDWGDPSLYDLTLNTERVPIATCVDQVVALARSAAFKETAASRRHLEDLALQARVRAALRADKRTVGTDVLVDARGGRIRLQGIVMSAKERGLAADVAGAVKGVDAVDNELRTMAGGLYRFPSQPTSRKDKG